MSCPGGTSIWPCLFFVLLISHHNVRSRGCNMRTTKSWKVKSAESMTNFSSMVDLVLVDWFFKQWQRRLPCPKDFWTYITPPVMLLSKIDVYKCHISGRFMDAQSCSRTCNLIISPYSSHSATLGVLSFCLFQVMHTKVVWVMIHGVVDYCSRLVPVYIAEVQHRYVFFKSRMQYIPFYLPNWLHTCSSATAGVTLPDCN